MEVYSLDRNLNVSMIIDSFESFIWNVRYNDYGDFEIYTRPSKELIDVFENDTYVWIPEEPNRPMFIETIAITTDVEEGNHLKITGHSLESVLDRRIIYHDTELKGNLQDMIEKLLNASVINPTDTKRKIANFKMVKSEDTRITSKTVDTKVNGGEKLGETINTLCQEKDIGWRITFNDENEFVFELFAGTDRSYDQSENDYVVFSKDFDNLISSDYTNDKRLTNATATVIVGESDGYNKPQGERPEESLGDSNDIVYLDITDASGLDRIEVKTDCSNVSSKKEDDTQMWWAEYHDILYNKGREEVEKLIKNSWTFEAEVNYQGMFEYGKHYTVGDILQVENEYGITKKVRVTEMIRSQDSSGISMYPTFAILDENMEGGS